MALLTANHPACFVHREAQGSKSDSLIEFDAVADVCRLTDDNARAMIDEKSGSNRRPGMDVNPGDGMGMLRHDPRQQRDSLGIQFMGKAVDRDRKDCRIRKDQLVDALRRRIAVISRLDILRSAAAQSRHLSQKNDRLLFSNLMAVIADIAFTRTL